MEPWLTVWTVFLVVGVALFAIVAVVVGIGGFFDLRALFQPEDAGEEREGRER